MESIVALTAGELQATFHPDRGMIATSLRHRGEELLGRVGDYERALATGDWVGIPLLHPWANRLAGPLYRVLGREVRLDLRSPLLKMDPFGQPIHGVRWTSLGWEVVESACDRVRARLAWERPELLAVFPFPHALELEATLAPDALSIVTTLVADHGSPVPASFGFHSYFRLPGVPRAKWRLMMPALRRVELDTSMIPTGREHDLPAFDDVLGDTFFDNGYAALPEPATFTLNGGGRRLSVDFVRGYPFLQVYGVAGGDFLAIEPMTAPTNALVTHDRLRIVAAGERLAAELRVRVEDVR